MVKNIKLIKILKILRSGIVRNYFEFLANYKNFIFKKLYLQKRIRYKTIRMDIIIFVSSILISD